MNIPPSPCTTKSSSALVSSFGSYFFPAEERPCCRSMNQGSRLAMTAPLFLSTCFLRRFWAPKRRKQHMGSCQKRSTWTQRETMKFLLVCTGEASETRVLRWCEMYGRFLFGPCRYMPPVKGGYQKGPESLRFPLPTYSHSLEWIGQEE